MQIKLMVRGFEDEPLTVSAPLMLGTVPMMNRFGVSAAPYDWVCPYIYSYKGVSVKPMRE